MRIETLMCDILINARRQGETNANSITDRKDREKYLKAYGDAILQISLDLGSAFKRANKKFKNMEVM